MISMDVEVVRAVLRWHPAGSIWRRAPMRMTAFRASPPTQVRGTPRFRSLVTPLGSTSAIHQGRFTTNMKLKT